MNKWQNRNNLLTIKQTLFITKSANRQNPSEYSEGAWQLAAPPDSMEELVSSSVPTLKLCKVTGEELHTRAVSRWGDGHQWGVWLARLCIDFKFIQAWDIFRRETEDTAKESDFQKNRFFFVITCHAALSFARQESLKGKVFQQNHMLYNLF